MSLLHRRHTGERPFGCVKCGKRYFRKENLLIHEVRDCAKVQVSEIHIHSVQCVSAVRSYKVKHQRLCRV